MTPRLRSRPIARLHARGAALLAAMLVVTLVATFAASAMWQQWRAIEIETAERARIQSAWILVGALDWSRLILHEDARAGGGDHLAEPWAVPLAEARLSTFLASQDGAAQVDASTDMQDAFLSGQITDMQSRLNVASLVVGGAVQQGAHAQFTRLFAQLGLPVGQLETMEQALQRATTAKEAAGSDAALMPQQVEQLGWLGLPAASVAMLAPLVTVLPEATPVNLNTASPEVLLAAIDGLDRAGAENLATARETHPFRTLDEVRPLLPPSTTLRPNEHSVATNYFEVQGRLRLGDASVLERSLVYRTGTDVTTVWRTRSAGAMEGTLALAPPTMARDIRP
ncbi:MAG: type II secretion system minor pseudopilin GspK [Giesbergeria sp.]